MAIAARSLDELFNSSRFQWAKDALAYVLGVIRPAIPRRSGKLLNETLRRSTLRTTGDGFTIRHGTFYGHIWDVAGRKAYTVTGRKTRGKRGKSVLRMNLGVGEFGFKFARRANIPAGRPTNFMRDAVTRADPGVRDLAEKFMTGSLNNTLLNRVIRVGTK